MVNSEIGGDTMESKDRKLTKHCVFCGKRVPVDAYECNCCGNIIQDLAPKYAPGKEPENIKAYLQSLFGELNEEYSDCIIDFSTWNHERWDKAAVAMQKHLGYQNGGAFLKAYGYSIGKIAVPNKTLSGRTVTEKPRRNRNTASSYAKRETATSVKGFSKLVLVAVEIVAFAVVSVLGYNIVKNVFISKGNQETQSLGVVDTDSGQKDKEDNPIFPLNGSFYCSKMMIKNKDDGVFQTIDYRYNDNAQIIEIIDEENGYRSQCTYEYDNNGNILNYRAEFNTYIEDDYSFSYEYDNKRRIINASVKKNIIDNHVSDKIVNYHNDYDGDLWVNTLCTMEGYSNTYYLKEYDSNNNIISEIHYLDGKKGYKQDSGRRYEYDDADNLIRIYYFTNVGEYLSEYNEYDSFGNLVLHFKSPNGYFNKYDYDSNNRLVCEYKIKKKSGYDFNLFTDVTEKTIYEYNSNGQIIEITKQHIDPYNNDVYDYEVRKIEHNKSGDVSRILNCDEGDAEAKVIAEFTYDKYKNLVQANFANELITFEYVRINSDYSDYSFEKVVTLPEYCVHKWFPSTIYQTNYKPEYPKISPLSLYRSHTSYSLLSDRMLELLQQ